MALTAQASPLTPSRTPWPIYRSTRSLIEMQDAVNWRHNVTCCMTSLATHFVRRQSILAGATPELGRLPKPYITNGISVVSQSSQIPWKMAVATRHRSSITAAAQDLMCAVVGLLTY